MADLKQTLLDLAKCLVDSPDEVTVTEETDGDVLTLTLQVAPSDMGKVIGKGGKIAKSIRTLLRAAAGASERKLRVEIH